MEPEATVPEEHSPRDTPDPAAPTPLPIDGVLDLHPFRPKDVQSVVVEYLAACQNQGILNVRIIHGKGIGQLKRTVHAMLARHPMVVEYHLDHVLFSGAGATLVRLRPAGS